MADTGDSIDQPSEAVAVGGTEKKQECDEMLARTITFGKLRVTRCEMEEVNRRDADGDGGGRRREARHWQQIRRRRCWGRRRPMALDNRRR
ncbi:hypothetical protein LINGRAHAP2_LOCUS14139 [Linum grandiflorum]